MHPCALFPQEGQLTQPVNWPPGLPRGVRQLTQLLGGLCSGRCLAATRHGGMNLGSVCLLNAQP